MLSVIKNGRARHRPDITVESSGVSSGIYLHISTQTYSAIFCFVILGTIYWLPHVVIVNFTSLKPPFPTSLSVYGGINIFG